MRSPAIRWRRSAGIALWATALWAIAGMSLFAPAAVAQVPAGAGSCVARISKSANQYLRTISKVRQMCFQLQMQGRVPLPPALDCTDSTTWPGGGDINGAAIVAAARLATTAKIEKLCASNHLQPRLLGFDACPAPCTAVAPSLDTFADVSSCLQCLGDRCKQAVDKEAYGSVTLRDQRSDLPALVCQTAIGRAVADYTYKRLKLQAKCQSRHDQRRSGWESVDCTALEDLSHPQHGDFLALMSKLQGAVAQACPEPELLTSVLDSCGSDVTTEQGCLHDAAATCLRWLHVGIYPQTAPTPTAFIAPSPTPSPTPKPPGKPCNTDSDCSDSVCSVDGICCDSRCAGTCESCRDVDTGAGNGECRPILRNQDPQAECNDGSICTLDSCDGLRSCQHLATNRGALCGDTSTSECSAPDTCDDSGVCRSNHILLGTQCGPPNDICERHDTCDGNGSCVHNGLEPSGAPCGSAESECSAQDTCDGAGHCLGNDYVAGKGCGDLLGPCTYADVCDGRGVCVDGGYKTSGTFCGLPGTECSGQDTCDGAGICQPNHLPVTVACGPTANECTVAGHCDGTGRCTVEFRPVGTVCGAPGTQCSDQDTCDGYGTCRANDVAAGTHCGDAGTVCTNQDVCDGNGACVDKGYKAPGTSCGDAPNECSERDSCDGGGNCLRNDFRAGTPCGSALATDCTAPDTCSGAGVCVPNNAPEGSNCGDAGNECTVQDKCDAAGHCVDHGYISAGTACGDQRDTVCTDPDTCDGKGVCARHDAPNTTPCGDSANDCRLQDACDGFGECADHGFRPQGTPCGSQVDNACDHPDSCDTAGTCRPNYSSSGTACGNPGTECKVQDTCNGSGGCVDQGFRAAGTSCGDHSTTQCTAPDSCNGSGACGRNDATSGTPCGDTGTQCIVQDTCDGNGACHDNGFVARNTACGSPAATQCDNPDSCDGAGTCRANYSPSGTACGSPGTACVNQDVCNGSGTCLDVGTAPVGSPCADDNNPCTDDICGAGGACLHVPNQAPCDDGVFCNGIDTCSAGGCTVHAGNPCPGADGDTNCSESCNEAAKSCTAPDPDGSTCDDHLFCNGKETCIGGVCVSENIDPCKSGGTYGGDDDNDCKESCDEFTNTCTAPDPDGMPCNDRTATSNKFCTGGDVGNACLIDSDCMSGVCADVCTGPDNGKACSSNADCKAPGNCSGRACASPVYKIREADGILHIRTIQQDQCVAGVCIAGAPPCKGDALDALGRGIGLSETCQDACHESTDSCDLRAQDNIDCRDDDFCNGVADTCKHGTCVRSGDPCDNTCVNGGDPADCLDAFARYAVGDADNDCSETCRATTTCSGWGCVGRGNCTAHDPAGTACADGNFCTKGDTCDGSGHCITGHADPCDNTCADGDPDLDTCPNPIERFNVGDEDNDCSESCRDIDSSGWEKGDCKGNDPQGTPCTDYVYCNGTETCNGQGSCTPGDTDPCASRIGDGDSNCNEACKEPDDNACRGGSKDGDPCDNNGDCPGGFCLFGNDSGSCTAHEPDGTKCDDGLYCDGNRDRCEVLPGHVKSTCVPTATGSQLPCHPLDTTDSNCTASCRESAREEGTCAGGTTEGASCTADTDCGGCIPEGCFDPPQCININPFTNQGHCSGGTTEGASCFTDAGCRPCRPIGCVDPQCIGFGHCSAYDPAGTGCNDGSFCNGTDTCNGSGGCTIHSGDPCIGPGNDPAHGDNLDCHDGCRNTDFVGNGDCHGADNDGTPCPDDGHSCNGEEVCYAGVCRGTEVCCPEGVYTFTLNSNHGGAFDSAEWPGNSQTLYVTPRTDVLKGPNEFCNIVIHNPSDNIDLAGHLGDHFEVEFWHGFTECHGEGGEDGDGCDVTDCPPAGHGYCEATRPSCTAALNGTATAEFHVRCSD